MSFLAKFPKLIRLHGIARLSIARWRGAAHLRTIYGVKLAANYDDKTFRLYMLGTYGFFYSDLLARIDHPFHLIDIGANQGLYTMLAARNPNCISAVAFEPVARTADLLEANLALNNLTHKTTVIRKALSDSITTAQIKIIGGHSGQASIADANHLPASRTETIALTDHTELAACGLHDGVPIYIKIDVEGHEEVVITQCLKFSRAADIRQIFYECDERWVGAQTIATQLQDHGFHLQQIGDGVHYDVLAQRPPGDID